MKQKIDYHFMEKKGFVSFLKRDLFNFSNIQIKKIIL